MFPIVLQPASPLASLGEAGPHLGLGTAWALEAGVCELGGQARAGPKSRSQLTLTCFVLQTDAPWLDLTLSHPSGVMQEKPGR